jgi:hypothetical protein
LPSHDDFAKFVTEAELEDAFLNKNYADSNFLREIMAIR